MNIQHGRASCKASGAQLQAAVAVGALFMLSRVWRASKLDADLFAACVDFRSTSGQPDFAVLQADHGTYLQLKSVDKISWDSPQSVRGLGHRIKSISQQSRLLLLPSKGLPSPPCLHEQHLSKPAMP